MRLIFNTIFLFFYSNFRNEFSICFSNFCNKIIKICLNIFKIVVKLFYLNIVDLNFIFIYIEIFLQLAWPPPLAPAWPPPPEYKFWLRPCVYQLCIVPLLCSFVRFVNIIKYLMRIMY